MDWLPPIEWTASALASMFRRYAEGRPSADDIPLGDPAMMLDQQLKTAGSNAVRAHLG